MLLGFVGVDGNDAAGKFGQHSGGVAGTGADFEHGVLFGELQALNQAGNHFGLKHGAAVGQGQGEIGVGVGLLFGGNELFARHFGQGVENVEIQYAPGADLLFDHVESGLFKVVHYFAHSGGYVFEGWIIS